MRKIHRTRCGAIVLATVLTTSTLASIPALASVPAHLQNQRVFIHTEFSSIELEDGISLEQYTQMQMLSLAEEQLAGLAFVKEFTMEAPAALNTLDMTGCNGSGTFAFADPAFIPEKGIVTCELIFTPEDAGAFQYENMIGWNAETKTVHRFVQVYCTSLMTEEEKLAKAAKDAAKDAVTDQEATEDEWIMAPGVTVNPDDVLPETGEQLEDTVAGEDEKTPEVTVIPEATVVPEVTVVPETTVVPEVTVVPETTVVPEVTVVPETTVTPETSVVPEATEQTEVPAAPTKTEAVTALEASIAALSDTVADDTQLHALLEVSKVYNALSEEDKLLMDMECGKKLADLQAVAAVYNHTCKGVAVSGNIPWYVALKVELDNDTENYVPTGLETIVPYEISLWDTMNNVEFLLAEGEKATLTMKKPENLSLYDGLKVVHYLNETVYEFIELKLDGEYMSFETASFSPFNVAGSNVLVGGSDKTPVTPTPTPTPTATPTPQPTTTTNPTATATPTPTPKPSSSTNKNNSSTNKNNSSSSTNKNNNKTTAAKTGDEAQTSRFLMLGMSAFAMMTAAGMILVRRRRPEND